MLGPYELQNNKFSKALKGYSTAEVDEHIAFIIAKYTELYNAYNELERKQKKTEAELGVCRKNEEAATQALVNAKAHAQKLVDDAERRSEEILASAKEETDKILIEFKKKIKSEKDALRILHARVADFRDTIYSQYHQHIELLESISPELEPEDDWSLEDNEYVTIALHQIQLDVAKAESEHESRTSGSSRENAGGRISDEMLEKLVTERDSFSGLGNAALGYDVDSDLINR
ncbi:MAG: DivIVA domain-containing protein [Clostridia bacterium]|nr:DivIVA domain-containing protein [Clostridia bacterium]